MNLRARFAAVLVLLACATSPGALHAQRPSTQQAQQLLRTRPDLVAALRARIVASGMTPEQIRARLRAEGYPEDLLDPYLPGMTGAGVEPTGAARDSLIIAIQSIGIVDSTESRLLAEDCDPMLLDSTAAVAAADSTPGTRRARRICPTRPTRDTLALALEDSGFTIFGLDIFRGATTQFDPNVAGPVDANYRFGPGDRIALILTGDVEATYQFEVSREGFILIPTVGQVFVANLTLAELQSMLRSRLSRSYSGIGAGTLRFSVSVTGLRSVQVYVLGDVTRPGAYQISSLGTALSALYAAGGPTRNGSLRRIVVRRGRAVVDTLDVYQYLLNGDASHDPRLQNGDVVFVPVHGPRVRVLGEVIRPATYELRPGETLPFVLSAAGGFTDEAARRRVLVERILPSAQRANPGSDRIAMDVSSQELQTGLGPPIPLLGGDVVRVFPISERIRNRIVVRGNVWQPGPQGLTSGMTLSQALRSAGGVKPDTYLGRVLITRLNTDSSRVQLRASLRDTTGSVLDDVVLREDDEIEVFSTTEFRPDRYVGIAGAVRKGGRFLYREGMTVRDLVLLAGGLEEGAYLNEAEIARLPEDRANGKTATTIRVPLDSSYVFERGLNGYQGPPGLQAPSGTAPEVVLEPYDNVLILRQPDFQLQRSVVITGEVRFPGRYTLLSRTERLTDLLQRTGGTTGEAYPQGVYFHRRSERIGRIGIDLPKVLRNARERDNLVLLDGDSIHVPQYKAVVNVTGSVHAPLAVAFRPGQSISYYIAAAGGATRSGDASRAYVMQPNGKVESSRKLPLFPDLKPDPGGGSTVFVPPRAAGDGIDYLQFISTLASTIAAAVTTYVLVRNTRGG